MKNNTNNTLEDYVGKLNLEGDRDIWKKNHSKIQYVLDQVNSLINNKLDIAEVGIGDGYLLTKLMHYSKSLTAIDISKYLVDELGKKFKSINFIHSDITKIEHEANCFDIFFCLDILEHLENLDEGIEKIENMLRADGLLVGTLPLNENIENNMVVCPECQHRFHKVGHFHAFKTKEDIEHKLKDKFTLIEYKEVEPYKFHKISKRLKMLIKKILGKEVQDRYKTMFFIAKVIKQN